MIIAILISMLLLIIASVADGMVEGTYTASTDVLYQ